MTWTCLSSRGPLGTCSAVSYKPRGARVEPEQAKQYIAIACGTSPIEERITAAVLVMRWEARWRTAPPERPPWPDDIVAGVLARLQRDRPDELRRLTPRIYHGRAALPDPEGPPAWQDVPITPEQLARYERMAETMEEQDQEADRDVPRTSRGGAVLDEFLLSFQESLRNVVPPRPAPRTPAEARTGDYFTPSGQPRFGHDESFLDDADDEEFVEDDDAADELPGPVIPGYRCAVCKSPVHATPHGTLCTQRHGGAPTEPIPGKRTEAPGPREWDFSKVTIPLSDEQRAGLVKLLEAVESRKAEIRLAGVAGSGKTTLMRAFIEMLGGKPYYLLAPTNQARKRLQEVTGVATNTIHSFIYPKPEEDPAGELRFPDPRLLEDVDASGVFITDETSMIGEKLARDLRRIVRGTIVWVGDPEQLPPVGEPPGVDLKNAEVTLLEVHRQAAGSPPLALATEVRTTKHPAAMSLYNLAKKYRIPFMNGGPSLIANRLFAEHKQGRDSVALVWTNASRKAINTAYRVAAGATSLLQRYDRIVICSNHYHLGLLNGEVLFVEDVTWEQAPPWLNGCLGNALGRIKIYGRKEPLYTTDLVMGAERKVWQSAVAVARAAADQIFPEGSDAHMHVLRSIYAIVHADYAYAMTTHRYQGSQAESVFLAWEQDWTWKPHRVKNEREALQRFEDTRRWLYTSLTRTRKDLVIISLDKEK